MKSLKKIMMIVLIIVTASSGFSQTKGSEVDVYYHNKYQYSLTEAEFSELLKSARFFLQLTEAEENGKLIIELEDKEWKISSNEKFITKATFRWKAKDGTDLKSIEAEVSVIYDAKNNKISLIESINQLYTNVAGISFPILLLIILLLL